MILISHYRIHSYSILSVRQYSNTFDCHLSLLCFTKSACTCISVSSHLFFSNNCSFSIATKHHLYLPSIPLNLHLTHLSISISTPNSNSVYRTLQICCFEQQLTFYSHSHLFFSHLLAIPSLIILSLLCDSFMGDDSLNHHLLSLSFVDSFFFTSLQTSQALD